MIGCGIDREASTVEYWLNGKKLGFAIESLAFDPNEGPFYYPFFRISQHSCVNVNLKGPFSHLPEGYRGVGDVQFPERILVACTMPKRYNYENQE